MRSSAVDEAEAQIKCCCRHLHEVGIMHSRMLIVEALWFTICRLFSVMIVCVTNNYRLIYVRLTSLDNGITQASLEMQLQLCPE